MPNEKYCNNNHFNENKIKTQNLYFMHKSTTNLYICKKNCTFATNFKLHYYIATMNDTNQQYVYQESAIEFVTVAVQLCLYLEQAEAQDKADFIEKMLCLLPLLYIKARLVPKNNEEMDGYLEQFVTEYEYDALRQMVANKFGSDDAYLEVFVEDMRYSDEPITAFISENIADIYQEIKDLSCSYQTEDEQMMQEALSACIDAFEQHWGQKLLNVLRPLHALSLACDE